MAVVPQRDRREECGETVVMDAAAILGADYEHMVPLTPGGTGEVFRAHKRGLDVDVVVKRVKSRYQGQMSERREANILKNLRHQYLPRIYDIISGSDGFLYTVMDYIPGCDLEQYVARYGALPQKLVVKWMRQLCEVVVYLHSQKPAVIHCDLKPANIMVTPEGNLCLIDFNTALHVKDGEMQALGATCGYAAPEQYNISPQAVEHLPPALRDQWRVWCRKAQPYGAVTERTDVYGMGAVAYFMLTGYTPGHCLEEVIPLERYHIALGEALRVVVEKAMRPDPARRFPSARGMLAALENLKKNDRRYRRWQRSCQVTAVALGLLLLLSGFSLWMGLELRRESRGEDYLALVEEADQLIAQQQYDESLKVLQEAVVLDEARIEAYIRTSTVLYRLGRYQECVDLLSGLTFVYDSGVMTQADFDYAQAELNYVLGSCRFQLEDYAGAEENFSLAAWFAPDEPRYLRDLAVCQAKEGSMEQAQATYQTLRGMENASPEDLLLVEGELSYAQGQYEAALTALRQLKDSADPALSSRSYLLAAQCCRALGDLEGEISLLEEAVSRLDASSSALHTQELADAYLRLGVQRGESAPYRRALELCQSLMERGTAALEVRLNAALAQQYLGDVPGALATVEQAVADYPNDYRGYARLAFLCLDRQVNDPDRARSAYEQAQTLYQAAGVQDSEMAYLASLMGAQG